MFGCGNSRLKLRIPTSNFQRFLGGHTARVTPLPIPNTEVKPRRADDTARVTVWERRSPPGLILKGRSLCARPFLFLRRINPVASALQKQDRGLSLWEPFL